MKPCLFTLAITASLFCSACGGGNSGNNTPPPANYTIGGTVSGLSGSGLVLQNNGANNLPISANGAFTFTTPVTSGAAYAVTVLTQPSSPAQTCTVTSGSGTATSNVTTVQVACTTTTYTIGGTISGLSGTGLVLQNNGANNLSISANGPFTFTAPITSGGTYAVTVLTQPSSPAQTCTVTNGSGTVTANVTTVQVACTTTTYTIGGTVSGLSGTGLVLQNNGGNNLPISANGPFTFTTPVASGAGYAVTVLTQPSSPAQTCAVTNGTGTAAANVTTVQVACTTNVPTNTWTWIDGSDVVNQPGIYGTKGTAAPSNVPGGRDSATTWTDPSGNFWLFGGESNGSFNDMWKYGSGEWTWMSGSNTTNQSGTYGTLGKANPANVPGARSSGASWRDAAGNFWLFGGSGIANTTGGDLNDLWEYSTGEWTWMGGSNVADQPGIYGIEGTAAAANVPGARHYPVSWTDQSGNFWLFGGVGEDVNGNYSPLNDLWEYSAGDWTWMSGADTINQIGTYGTKGTAAKSNVPGARSSGVSWIDASGNLWLFGGGGYDSASTLGFLNDLWKFSAGEWTWVGGAKLANQAATYGIEGTPSPSNIPAGRIQAASWIDASGTFWLFGGYGLDSAGATGKLNDLWKYSAGEWTWVSGSNVNSQAGTYGAQGVPSPGNIPGARQAPVAWVDAAGNFWLFGGLGYDSNGSGGELNDLWEYQP